ncbi:MAG: T9SS type A sorting domain-containing protein [Saprospiraceae bacterium]
MNFFRLILVVAGLILVSCKETYRESEEEEGGQSGAGLALNEWIRARFPEPNVIESDRILLAYEASKKNLRSADKAQWKSLGPKNIGGRTLCLAFHPTDPNIIYAGSASGGLWKSYSSGIGYNAWQQVPINFPVYSIASILISPRNPDILFVGTGEVYNKHASVPGIIDRTTRGTYGMGILKSINGGKSWTQSLPLTQSVISGVQTMKFDPYDDQIIYAATTQGLYKSTNQGNTWTLIHDVPMAVDFDININNPEIIYVTHGSYQDNAISGIYKSNNSGVSFVKLKNGLPESYSGKALLDISKSNPNILYASIANELRSVGLFMSIDGGTTWDMMNSTDVANVQGWYSHDIAIDPTNPDYISYVGQNAYISEHKGKNFLNISSWDAGDMGRVPVGGAESSYDIYVHADIHATYFHPLKPNEIYFATDGGIFVSTNRGMSFEGRNGGYQTTQFYANFSASKSNPNFAIGGMQDNGTAIYDGQDGWIKVIGGDGMSTAINPMNEKIIFGTYQNFGLNRSLDGGKTFDYIKPANNSFEVEGKSFNTPFEIIPSAPNSIYAGAQKVYLNENNGNPASWRSLQTNPLDANSTILTLGVSPTDRSLLLASTSPLEGLLSVPKLFKSTNGGITWTRINDLPYQSVMDICFDPINGKIIYIALSGFGVNSHLYKSIDGGDTWKNIDNGLPDVPTNCIAINPKNTKEIYVGNDLGVYISSDGGLKWERFMEGLPTAVMAMSMTISSQTDQIKLATHGNGVYESPLAFTIPNKDVINSSLQSFLISPNPASDQINTKFNLLKPATCSINIMNMLGQSVYIHDFVNPVSGSTSFNIDIHSLNQGTYTMVLLGKITTDQSPFYLHKRFIKL